jgi:hypothetical protein
MEDYLRISTGILRVFNYVIRINQRVIVLAEPRAVRDGGLRLIRDKGGIPRIHVTAGGSHVLTFRDLGASRCGRIP